ncbi:hypothetical protein KDW69_21030 [Burkholderia ambifaria]|nr:hypothetical protein [Burkholderia ambifaria]
MRRISLENHLALAAMRSGRGSPDTMVALLRVLYLLFFLLEGSLCDDEQAWLLEAEDVLDESIRGAEGSGDWHVDAQKLPIIERLLLRCDEAVASVPKFRYVDAWQKMETFVRSPERSPLPGSRLADVWVD